MSIFANHVFASTAKLHSLNMFIDNALNKPDKKTTIIILIISNILMKTPVTGTQSPNIRL